MSSAAVAQIVLAIHVAVIAFNVAGLVLVPLGAALGWRWIRLRGLRAAHLASLGVVAVQALMGRACFLTDWQMALGGAEPGEPLIARWINGLIYWPQPAWMFAVAYAAVFAYVLALWWLVPPEQRIVRSRT